MLSVIWILFALTLPIPTYAKPTSGYVFRCIENCLCESRLEVVSCGPFKNLTHVPLPSEGNLPGIKWMMLSSNHIVQLPDEDVLLEKFPDLKNIDITLNPLFNCSQIENFKTISIESRCDELTDPIDDTDSLYSPERFKLFEFYGRVTRKLAWAMSKFVSRIKTKLTSNWNQE